MRIRDLLALAFAASLPAQFTSSALTLTPAVATVTGTGQPVTQIVPAGTDASELVLSQSIMGVDGGFAFAACRRTSSSTRHEYMAAIITSGRGQGSASIAAFDIAYRLQAPSPMTVKLQLQWSAPPINLPTLQGDVDVGNDGTFEFLSSSGSSLQLPLVVGPGGLVVRLRLGASAAGGQAVGTLRCTILPDVPMVLGNQLPGCDPGNEIGVHATLDHELVFSPSNVAPPFAGTNALVIGAQVNPVVLPLGGCVLLPTPDYVALFATSCTVDISQVLQRPLTFYVQSVHFDWAANVLKTGAFRPVTLQ